MIVALLICFVYVLLVRLVFFQFKWIKFGIATVLLAVRRR